MNSALVPTVVGNLNETGLAWIRNGGAWNQNSPHSVAPTYQIHGSMNPVWYGNTIEYLDFVNYRHNIGPGGNAQITMGGTMVIGP